MEQYLTLIHKKNYILSRIAPTLVLLLIVSTNSLSQTIGSFVNSEEFIIFKFESSKVNVRSVEDFWFADFDFENIDINYNSNEIEWQNKSNSFKMFITDYYAIVTYKTFNKNGSTIFFDRKTKKLFEKSFITDRIHDKILKCYRSRVDKISWLEYGSFDLNTLRLIWGAKNRL